MTHREELKQAAEYQKATGYLPDLLLDRPEISRWAQPYWEAFRSLSGSRSVGMAAGAIPLSEILAWCRLQGISDPEEIDDLMYFIGELDGEWLGWQNKER